MLEDRTQLYYDRNAEQYFSKTVNISMDALYERFLRYIHPGGRILDAGSGSGRDTLAFIQNSYEVEAFDASIELAALSTQYTGISTKVMRFQDLTEVERYDGIWACASLIHVPRAELADVLSRFGLALKPGGALYVSFKYGSEERGAEGGRHFTDMDETLLTHLFDENPYFQLKEIWVSLGEKHFKGIGKWINAIAAKTQNDCSNH